MPFWTPMHKTISDRLWFPNDIPSYFSPCIDRLINPFPTQRVIRKDYCPIIKPWSQETLNTHASDRIPQGYLVKNIKIPIVVHAGPARETLKEWFNTTRYVYNKGVELLRQPKKIKISASSSNGLIKIKRWIQKPIRISRMTNGGWKISKNTAKQTFPSFRDRLITRERRDGTINNRVKDWELKTPKDIRAESLRDLFKNYQTLLKRKAEGSVKHFTIKFKTSKDPKASMVINKRSIKILKDGIQIFGSYLPNILIPGKRTKKRWFTRPNEMEGCRLQKEWNGSFDVRLVKDRYRFWFLFPVLVKKKSPVKEGLIALDPGVRAFQTGMSEKELVVFREKRLKLVKLWRRKIDNLRRARSLNEISNGRFSRCHYRWFKKLEGRVTNLHWETVTYLRKDYDEIFLPHFESQEMRSKGLGWIINRDLDYFCHYRFKCRMKEKCEEWGVKLYLVDEDYTSKTCGRCGEINSKLGGNRVFTCNGCKLKYGRDVNGARNILMKNLKTKVKLRLIVKCSGGEHSPTFLGDDLVTNASKC